MLLTKKTLARAALALSILSCAAAATIDLVAVVRLEVSHDRP
jgi:hypothetical protein